MEDIAHRAREGSSWRKLPKMQCSFFFWVSEKRRVGGITLSALFCRLWQQVSVDHQRQP